MCKAIVYYKQTSKHVLHISIVAGTDPVMFLKSKAVYQTVKNILVVFSAKILNSVFMWYSFLLEF